MPGLKSLPRTRSWAFWMRRFCTPSRWAAKRGITSHFTWNRSLHASFVAGNVRSLALDFTISLDHPTSRRLFRLLEVLRYANKPPRPQISIGLEKLRDRLGMTTYKYPSNIVEKLAPAVEELVTRGYLDGMAVEKDAKGGPMAVFRFRNSLRPGTRLPAAKAPETPVAAPQTRNEAPPVDLSNLAALLPSFEVPSPSDFNDLVGDQLDVFFETLPQDERDEIDARVRAALLEMLRDNPRSSGAAAPFRVATSPSPGTLMIPVEG